MRNRYLENLEKLEFVVTDACTGRCRHCSEGDHTDCGAKLDPLHVKQAVKRIAAEYDIKTVMTFGGEPLLHADAVFSIIGVASELGIPRRQVITNGYFSKNPERIRDVARRLCECGVNDLLLSVDAFHQETIPLETVRIFAAELKKFGVPTRLQPAWLVSKDDKNPYNLKTREILDSFSDMELFEGSGNVIFPEGNALKNFSEYFRGERPENPYVEDPKDLRCLSFSANGDVLDGNIYREDIADIINKYKGSL